MAAFSDLINDYKQLRMDSADPLIRDCMRERDILKVIEMASLSRDAENSKHPHQYRLQNQTLVRFSDKVLRNADKIISAKTFDEIHDIISASCVKGIGDLTIYDTAHRIGLRLKRYPDKVYMHRGTRQGAERLLKRKVYEKALDKTLFKEFSKLRADEIEDILCIYKDNIRNGKCLKIGKTIKVC